MLKIGITGGIGSGKSLVGKAFALLNAPMYNADVRAKWLIKNNTTIKNQVIELLGNEAYLENGEYNRRFVAEVVFNNSDLLNKLNAIVHPAVQQDALRWFEENKHAVYVIYEAAIMNSAGNSNLLDYIIVVSADEETRIQRILKRDPHRLMTDVQGIMANQKSDVEFREIADFIIFNNEDDLILEQVLVTHEKLLTL